MQRGIFVNQPTYRALKPSVQARGKKDLKVQLPSKDNDQVKTKLRQKGKEKREINKIINIPQSTMVR